MPTTTTREQERWHEIVAAPQLQALPYKVESNAQGQILLRPHTTRRARQQKAVMRRLDALRPDGDAFQEWPVVTEDGTRQADVVWTSPERLREMDETGDPPTLAPELCVEVLSESSTVEERAEKRALYRAAGAEEVWIVEADGRVRFFRDEEVEQSDLVPEFPTQISATDSAG
jgi:Uma2 family endonuclease